MAQAIGAGEAFPCKTGDPFVGLPFCFPRFQFVHIPGPLPADELRPGPGADQVRFADVFDVQSHRYRDLTQMHADQRVADVHARLRPDVFHRHRVRHRRPHRRGKRAARMGPGPDVHRLVSELLRRAPLYDQRTVQMLAALHRQQDPLLLQDRGNPVIDGLRRLHARAFPDALAHDLAGRTADHQQLSPMKL